MAATATVADLLRLSGGPLDPVQTSAASFHHPARRVRTQNAGIALTDAEHQRVRALVDACSLHETVVMPNVDARARLLQPPTGYVGIVHEQATFNCTMLDRNLFRGCAGVRVDTDQKLERMQSEILMRLNQLIPEKSPQPLSRLRDNGATFVCSLGPFAWIGLYEFQLKAGGKFQKTLLVVSGLDDASYAEMYDEAFELHQQKRTVREAMDRLAFWRAGAAENRERLLALARKALFPMDVEANVSRLERITLASSSAANDECQPGQQAADCAAWLRLKTYPLWYRMPRAAPNLCSDIAPELRGRRFAMLLPSEQQERHHLSMKPDFNVVLDDVSYFRDTFFVRRAGCCSTMDDVRAAVELRGPLNEVHVLKLMDVVQRKPSGGMGDATAVASAVALVDATNGLAWHTEFDSIPAQAPQKHEPVRFHLPSDAPEFTWENQAITYNRLVWSTYANRGPNAKNSGGAATEASSVSASDGANEAATGATGTAGATGANGAYISRDTRREVWVPLCVRVSCTDSVGFSYPDDPNADQKRLSGFVDDGYVALER